VSAFTIISVIRTSIIASVVGNILTEGGRAEGSTDDGAARHKWLKTFRHSVIPWNAKPDVAPVSPQG
jgi:hypothetical protein